MKKNVFYLMSMGLALTMFLSVSMKTEAQVTMGDVASPHPASLLDLRTSKGLLLSKVRLEKATKFQLSVDKAQEAKGTIIYNTNPQMEGGYGEGLYLWDGLKWNFIEENEMPVIDCAGPPYGITINGFSGTVNLNETIIVSCKVNTSGNTTYTWTIPQGLEVSGDRDKSTITLVAKVAGLYSGESLRCAVANACGGGSSIAGSQLTVNGCTASPNPGDIQFSPVLPISIGRNGSFTVSVTDVSQGNNVSYAWELPTGLSADGNDYTKASIRITGNVGTYSASGIKVTVSNPCGTATKNGNGTNNITINNCTGVPTANMSTITGSYIRNAGTFDVTCSVTSEGTNSYEWAVPSGLTITGGQGTNKITVRGTTAGDYQGSTITCVVKNECDTQGQSFHPSGSVTITGEGKEGGYNTYCFPEATNLPCWMTDNSREGNSYYWYEGAAAADVQHSIVRGKYYSYAFATQKSGSQYTACPAGWTLPNEQDFKNLIGYLSTHPYEKAKYMHENSYAGFGMINGSGGFAGSMGWGYNFGWWGDGILIFSRSNDNELTHAEYRNPVLNTTFVVSVRCIKRQ